jgi:hypothetical protein
MSKYALKLEQLVQTDNYGDILITIQYDGDGPKLVTANGDTIPNDQKHILDTILGLVNFTLAKGIAPSEVADQLEAEPQDGMHLPINDLLMIIAASLKEAPNGIEQINPGILMEVIPEMIKEFTQGGEGAAQPNYPTPDSSAKPEDKKKSDDKSKSDDKGGNFFGGFSR